MWFGKPGYPYHLARRYSRLMRAIESRVISFGQTASQDTDICAIAKSFPVHCVYHRKYAPLALDGTLRQ